MDYENSICFSSEIPERLNEKAFAIDKRLYLFAYYEPKEYRPKDNFRSKFSTAIINIYGLLWDCCPFMRQLLEGQDSILLSNWQRTKNEYYGLRNVVSAFRSVFCHNTSEVYPLQVENIDIIEDWISLHGCVNYVLSDVTEKEWENLLAAFHNQVYLFFKDLESHVDALSQSKDVVRRNGAIDHWIKAIAGSYIIHKDNLLNVMVDFYQLYLMKTHSSFMPDLSLRDQTINWLVRYCQASSREKWYQTWIKDTDVRDICHSKIFITLNDWPNIWANWNGASPDECEEAPMPGSDFLRIIASDVDNFVANPYLGYQP